MSFFSNNARHGSYIDNSNHCHQRILSGGACIKIGVNEDYSVVWIRRIGTLGFLRSISKIDHQILLFQQARFDIKIDL